MSRERDVDLAEGVLTRDAHAVVSDPDIDLVVEVIGGIEPARELITTALSSGKPVITANKELLANVGTELFAKADECGVDLLFEAAVEEHVPHEVEREFFTDTVLRQRIALLATLAGLRLRLGHVGQAPSTARPGRPSSSCTRSRRTSAGAGMSASITF